MRWARSRAAGGASGASPRSRAAARSRSTSATESTFGRLRARFGAVDGRGRVRRRIAFDVEELVELPHRREAARGGRRLQPALLEARHIGPAPPPARPRRHRCVLPPRKRHSRRGRGGRPTSVLRGGAALGGQHVQEQRDEAPAAHLAGRREAGIVTVISRGSGSTRVASANIAAKPRPASTAITNRKRSRVGT